MSDPQLIGLDQAILGAVKNFSTLFIPDQTFTVHVQQALDSLKIEIVADGFREEDADGSAQP